MGDDIGSGLLSMAVCFYFRLTNVVQLSNQNRTSTGHHPAYKRPKSIVYSRFQKLKIGKGPENAKIKTFL